MSVALRPFLPADGPALARIFRESVEVLAQEDYSERQRLAWASRADDLNAFISVLAKGLTLSASWEGERAGFACLDGDKITMLFVHPKHARRGVANALVDALEKLAAARGLKTLQTEASDTARDFFAQRGYDAVQRNSRKVDDEWLASTTMKKRLERFQP